MSKDNKPDQGVVTALLVKAGEGDENASAELFKQVYAELREMAASKMRDERGNHTYQATDLVHEVFVKLIGKDKITPENRVHFFGICSKCMKRILVDYARAHNAKKRGGEAIRLQIDSLDDLPGIASPEHIMALNLELDTLAKIDASRAQLAEMRLFAGLTLEEAALAMDTPYTTVQRKWKATRAWLMSRM
jgi:RNA polymerase sigma factor (TIGR02999 family)